MKKIIILLVVTLYVITTIQAQTPQKMSYQSVIRNSSNQLITNHTIGMRISILKDNASGILVYSETQNPSTNSNGLVTVEIGGQNGFDTINWSSGTYFIKTETDPEGGSNYTIIGTSQLLSVPYALHAKTVESFSSIRVSTSGDTLFFGNDQWVIIPNVSSANEAKITTSDISNITSSSATCGGIITSDGRNAILSQGVCWSTSPNPTINNSHTNDGNTGGTFISSITGLTSGTIYYVRAYITNKIGTYYGSQKTFYSSNYGIFVNTSAATKNVLLEIYGGTNCQYDPDGHRMADSLVNVLGSNKLYLIKVHAGAYAAAYTTSDGTSLNSAFSINANPTATLNREYISGKYSLGRSIWGNSASSTMTQPAYVNVAAITEIDTNTRKLTCTVQAYFTANSNVTTNYINIALTQDSIWGSQSGGQTWYPAMYNVATSKYKHNNMLRELITGVSGETMPANTSGTFYSKTFTYDIPASISNENIVFKNLNIIVFVTENIPTNASSSVVPRIINVNKSTVVLE